MGAISRLAGVRRSQENPNLCNRCNNHIREGDIAEIGVFFADLSGYTNMTQSLGPERTHAILDAYLKQARETIVKWDGFVTQFVGDEVMAFFNVPIADDAFAANAVQAGTELIDAMEALSKQFDHRIQTTVGIARGLARVGRVGSHEIAHYSAIGDVVNRAARLVSQASPGSLLIDEDVYHAVEDQFVGAQLDAVRLKGFDQPVRVASLHGRINHASVEPGDKRRKKIRFATTVAAILSAPCAGIVAINGIAIGLGLGAVSMGTLALWFDQSIIRLPLLAFAAAGACLILYTARDALPGFSSSQAQGVVATPTPAERRRNRWGIGLASISLLLVVAELILHRVLH